MKVLLLYMLPSTQFLQYRVRILKSVKLVSLQHFHGLADTILASYLAVFYFKASNTSFAV